MSTSWPWHTQSLLGDAVRVPDSRRPLSGGCCSEEGQGARERDGKGLLCLVMHSVVQRALGHRDAKGQQSWGPCGLGLSTAGRCAVCEASRL